MVVNLCGLTLFLLLIQEILVSGGHQKTPGLVKRLNRSGTFVGIASADPNCISASHLIKVNLVLAHLFIGKTTSPFRRIGTQSITTRLKSALHTL